MTTRNIFTKFPNKTREIKRFEFLSWDTWTKNEEEKNPCKIYYSRIFDEKPERNPSRILNIKFVKKRWKMKNFVCKKLLRSEKDNFVEWWKLIIIIYDKKIKINDKRMENIKLHRIISCKLWF